MTAANRVAVLIDCDNISHTLAKEILGEASQHGTVSVRRAYGDWSSGYLRGWRESLALHAIQPIQQPAYVAGKNSSDSALIIDAMDLLYANNVDVFYIVSSDSDFTRLAMRLRESGRKVHGIGSTTTPTSFTNACDRFTFTQVLAGQPLKSVAGAMAAGVNSSAPELPAAVSSSDVSTAGAGDPSSDPDSLPLPDEVVAPAPEVPDIKALLYPAVKAQAREDGWAMLSSVGHDIVAATPSFDSRNYGFPKLGMLVRSLPFVEIRDVPDPHGFNQPWIRIGADTAVEVLPSS